MEKLNDKSLNDLYFILDMNGINKEYDTKIDSLFKDFKQGIIDTTGLTDKLSKLEENKIAIKNISDVLNERLKDLSLLLK